MRNLVKLLSRAEDSYLHGVANSEKLMNGPKKDELPKQVEPSVHSKGDALINVSLDANDVGFPNVKC